MTANSVVASSVRESLAPSPRFTPNCYAVCGNGSPMPGQLIGRNSDGFIEVASPTGRVYSFRQEAILTVEEVEDHLHRDRVTEVASTYTFVEIPGLPQRTLVCSHPSRKASSYVITEGAGGMHCNCPAFAKSFGQTCKHIEALSQNENAAELDAKRKLDEAIRLGQVRAQVEAAAREARIGKPVRPYVEIKAEDW